MKLNLAFLLFTLLLVSCGQPYCIVGLGDCEKMYKGADRQIGQGGRLTLNPTLSSGQGVGGSVKVGETVKLNPNGGVSKYYCSVEPNACGTIDCTSYVFTASQPGKCEVTIKDSSPSPQTAFFTVNIVTQ